MMQSKTVLVTTSFSLLEVDVRTGEFRPIHRGKGLYYGLAQSPDNLFVAARGRMVSSDVPAHLEQGQVIVFDRELCEVSRLAAPFPLRDMHQIFWDRGRLLVTCSFDNMIAILEDGRWTQWYPKGEPEGEPRDVNHFNSISRFEDWLCVVAHNMGPSELMFFKDLHAPSQLSIPLGRQAHNVWRNGPEWLTCSSADGLIVGSAGSSVETGGFPRGVAFLDDVILVGVSELAERKLRDLTDGKILVFDPAWRLRNTIELPREGLVLDMLSRDEN